MGYAWLCNASLTDFHPPLIQIGASIHCQAVYQRRKYGFSVNFRVSGQVVVLSLQ